jgi:mannose-6-phosphate isomerase-like protein (cupin superfamily)
VAYPRGNQSIQTRQPDQVSQILMEGEEVHLRRIFVRPAARVLQRHEDSSLSCERRELVKP